MLEILVQGLEPEQFAQYEGISALVPDDSLEIATLPSDWRSYPHPATTKRYGDAWVASRRSLVLRVPSAVNPLEFNYLINPDHPDFASVEVHKPFALNYDPRLLEMLRRFTEG
jgi:RES domain-containing protein